MNPVEALGGCLQAVHGNPVFPSMRHIDDDAFDPLAITDTADPMCSNPEPEFILSLFHGIEHRFGTKLFHDFFLSGATGTVPLFPRFTPRFFRFASGFDPNFIRNASDLSGFEWTCPENVRVCPLPGFHVSFLNSKPFLAS